MYRIKRMKALVVLMIIAMLFMFMPAGALAESFSDIAGHWAERHINGWLERGLASGYADGTFCPDNPVSRAEFAVFVSRAFPRSQAANGAQLSDLDAEAWYYPAVSSAVSAGIMSGYGDGTFRPGNPITRQEAASVLTRLLGLGAGAAEPTFTDAGEIAAWAKGAVDAVAAAGIMGGYQADGTFRPQRPITRAETIVILDRGLVHAAEKIPQVSVTVYDLPGTYGPETGSETITGNVTVGSPDVTLRNMIITGDLLLSEAIGDGDVTLKSVTVRGETIVKGGGAESIVLEDCTLPSITVSKEGVRVVASGNTTVNVVTLESGATLVEVTISGPGFETVTISEVVPASAQITSPATLKR